MDNNTNIYRVIHRRRCSWSMVFDEPNAVTYVEAPFDISAQELDNLIRRDNLIAGYDGLVDFWPITVVQLKR